VTRWIVDGMNVIGSRPTGWWRDRPRAMRELVDELGRLDEPVTVVFDGRPFELDGDGVEVLFASRRGRNAADDDIAALVADAEDPRALTVVTSDGELAERVRERGAEVVGARSFRERLEDAGGQDERYAAAMLDWLACAARGRDQPAARAARDLGDPVVFAATAGHVLDFDDTYLPGLAHLSAPTAPAALIVAAERGLSLGDALAAYAAGFEAMGALARASHPALYGRGWHPTAVCGGVGAAVAAATLLDAPRETAVALALLRAGGLRAAFGSDGKSLQVGLAAGSGVAAARLAAAGASAPLDGAARGFEEATGGTVAEPDPAEPPAIEQNWIKAWPCCLQTHGAIEAADAIRDRAPEWVTVTVHPVSVQAAAYGPEPKDGLEAKFSIPYLTAFTLLHGPPEVASFDRVDPDAVGRAKQIEIETDPSLLESECVLRGDSGEELARVKAARGSPGNPMDPGAKVGDLSGALDDLERPAAEALRIAGLR
jgi:2-methylcitrate dehydratase PrpD/predicted RNA-binding protein with PIN domain